MVLDVTTACEYIKKQKKILLQSDTMLSFLTPQGRIYTMLLTLQGQSKIDRAWQKFHT